MIAVDAKRGDGDGDGEFKVVTRGRETLGADELVTQVESTGQHDGEEEDQGKVEDQRSGDPEDGDDLMDDSMALGGEEDEDGEDQAEERQGVDPFEESRLVPCRVDEFA